MLYKKLLIHMPSETLNKEPVKCWSSSQKIGALINKAKVQPSKLTWVPNVLEHVLKMFNLYL